MENLSEQAKILWAKKENRDGEERWLPLVAHLIDAQNVMNWLYEHWLNDGQRTLIQGNLSASQIKKLVNFLGYFHDIGKATPAFQTKESYSHDPELDDELVEKLLRNGFSELQNYDPSNRRSSPHAMTGETLLEDKGLNEKIGAIIGAHHGKPAEKYFNYEDQKYDYTSNYWQSDGDQHLQAPWKAVQQNLIDYGLSLSGYQSLADIPEINQEQAVLLTGLLIMADWIASSEYLNNDPAKPMFPLIRMDQTFDDLDMQKRYQNAIITWDVSDHWVAQPVVEIEQQYEKRWHFEPRPVQQLMSEQIGKIIDPGLIIVEAPMGIGKTEIALTAAEQLSFADGLTGVFMGLPTQATSNAMFSRVDDWVAKLAQEDREKLPIKLMHGKAQFNQENRNLPLAGNIDDDEGSVVVNSWFSGKKSMLADFSIGTIDHLLLMSLKQKHLFLRHLGLSGKVVIIDEVHAYDAYVNSYLARALNWLGAYHIPVIALSATLPKDRRQELMTAYYEGKYRRKIKGDLDWTQSQAYPLLTYMDGDQIKQFADFPRNNKSTTNQIVRLTCDDEQLIQKVLDDIKDGGVAGIIVNTVKRAQKLSHLIPKDVPKLTLHSAFLAPDRQKLEEKLQKTIGKNGQRPEKLIVIGTQVLEQSLDIDFDVLYTDIAPMDLILQRMGRLHRHQIDRPARLATPTTYILGINGFGDYGDANEAIYEKYWLMKTDYFLPDKIVLPDDISPLVQKVYDEKTNGEIAQIEGPYREEQISMEKEQKKATAYQLAFPAPSANLHGWLDRSSQAAASDADIEAAVRDIKESIEVVLVKHTRDGDFLLDGRSITDVRDEEIAQQLIRLPNAVTPSISKSIDELEKMTNQYYRHWSDSIWLRGVIALPLDDKGCTVFNGYHINYSKNLGLIYKKEEKDG